MRDCPFPPRKLFGRRELDRVAQVFADSEAEGVDFGYQGKFEAQYVEEFCKFQGAGFADVVATGTAAVFVAIAALQLPPDSHVIVSPITDPGTITAIILNQLIPVLADSMKDSYNIGPEQFQSRITAKTRAVVVVHAAGKVAPILEIVRIAQSHGILVVEDCSQAHGARLDGRKVGTFGDIAAFSTMYRKGHATGGSGGVVFTLDEERHRMALAYADRGKPSWKPDFDEKDPTSFLFPALNLHSDELSCAIGISTLQRLPDMIERRLAFLRQLEGSVALGTETCRLDEVCDDGSPFFHAVFVDGARLNCTKQIFAEAIRAEGIPLNPHYKYVVREWPWVQSHLSDDFECRNAGDCRDRSFNVLLNENYGDEEVQDIVAAIRKVECAFLLDH